MLTKTDHPLKKRMMLDEISVPVPTKKKRRRDSHAEDETVVTRVGLERSTVGEGGTVDALGLHSGVESGVGEL
jgi:hypothetical protein